MDKANKRVVFEIVFYVVMFFVLLGAGVFTMSGVVGFVGAALAFLGLLFVVKTWKGW